MVKKGTTAINLHQIVKLCPDIFREKVKKKKVMIIIVSFLHRDGFKKCYDFNVLLLFVSLYKLKGKHIEKGFTVHSKFK